MREQCGAHHENGKQCRAMADLTRVVISVGKVNSGSLIVPKQMTVLLCPKHFVFRDHQ